LLTCSLNGCLITNLNGIRPVQIIQNKLEGEQVRNTPVSLCGK
jgi:hypothetical protein